MTETKYMEADALEYWQETMAWQDRVMQEIELVMAENGKVMPTMYFRSDNYEGAILLSKFDREGTPEEVNLKMRSVLQTFEATSCVTAFLKEIKGATYLYIQAENMFFYFVHVYNLQGELLEEYEGVDAKHTGKFLHLLRDPLIRN